jgi:DNA-binding ferritin-like protein
MRKPYLLHEARMLMDTNVDINIDNLMTQWSSKRYGALAVLLAGLRMTFLVHQQNHWIVQGQTSYEDHLLFQRLYETIDDEIDTVAEKCIGVSDDIELVNVELQLKTIYQMLKKLAGSNSVLNAQDVIKKSLSVEYTLLKLCDVVKETLDVNGLLTNGIDNMIDGIYDVHEGHIYLLKRRG